MSTWPPPGSHPRLHPHFQACSHSLGPARALSFATAQQQLQGAPGCWKNCWFAQEWPRGCWNNPAFGPSRVPASLAVPAAANSHTGGCDTTCDTNCATSAALRAGAEQELQEGVGGPLQLIQGFPSSPRSWDLPGQRAGNGDFSHTGLGRSLLPREVSGMAVMAFIHRYRLLSADGGFYV